MGTEYSSSTQFNTQDGTYGLLDMLLVRPIFLFKVLTIVKPLCY